MRTILLISPYWKEDHRWMVSSAKLAKLWQRLGYRVVVVCMGKMEGRRTSIEDISPTLRIYRKSDYFLPDPLNFGIALGFSGYVRRIIREEKPDHIVFNKVLFWSSFAAIPLRLCCYRFDVLTDALVGITWKPRGLIPKIIMIIGGWTVGWLVLLSARRIALYHPQPEAILKRLGIAKKSRVIPTGIDPKDYGRPLNYYEHPVISRERGADGRLVITYVGRLESVKGVDDFLAAAVPLLDQYPDMQIQVAGWYKDRHALVSQYERQVRFLGLVEDVPHLLATTDIFVLPSYSEGLSNALMEAMASGCACVASEVGGNRYLIQNGVSGLLFPAGDREALRAHIHRLIQDPTKRKAMGEAARKRIEEYFSWEKVGEMYKAFFRETE